ncbi:unnamed protein product [Lupinus luteus]|uniref:Uncharacterized protein n=1 Tax=Lupinus luteus TaxID=3873 RepID=A0AAV1WTK4_LUPLU
MKWGQHSGTSWQRLMTKFRIPRILELKSPIGSNEEEYIYEKTNRLIVLKITIDYLVTLLKELAEKINNLHQEIEVGANMTGIFEDVSEASASRNHSAIIVRTGSYRDEVWAAFRNIMAEINESSRIFVLPNQVSFFCMQQNSESPESIVGLSDDVGAGFISGQPATSSELNVDKSVDLPSQDEIGNLGVSKVIRVASSAGSGFSSLINKDSSHIVLPLML